MNGQAMAQWLVENKNGKEWKKYGKERVYINVYVGGIQVANYFYDIVTDRFFGCDSKTEKAIRSEFEKATPNNNDTEKTEKLQKELETRKQMLNTQIRVKAAKEVIEENKKRIAELEKALGIVSKAEETKNEEATTEETTTEEVAEEVVEETKEVATEAKIEMKETASKISNELQNRFQMEQKEAQTEVKEILKRLASNTQDNLEKSEIKDMAANKKLSQFFQLQLLNYIYKELQKWIPRKKWSDGEFIGRLYFRDDFVTDLVDLVFNRNFEKLIKSIKDFIKKGGD